jgi:hypothetical protein
VVFASPCVAKRKHKVAKPAVAAVRASLDSAPVRQGVCWRFDVDHILRCLARALQDKVICSVREARPHSAKPDVLEASVIFLDPRTTAALQDAPAVPGQPHPLNDIAVRRVPSSWHMYTFLRDAMVGWKLSPEVAVVTLLYAERFEKVTGVSVTPDNWERLAIACMMLASKVWDDDSYENAEFAQICPLYSVDEINTMERVFLKLVDYKVIVGGAEYASTYFRLRVLGARDQANLQAQMEDSEPGARAVLQPLDNVQTEVLAQRGLLKQNEWRRSTTRTSRSFWHSGRAARSRVVRRSKPSLIRSTGRSSLLLFFWRERALRIAGTRRASVQDASRPGQRLARGIEHARDRRDRESNFNSRGGARRDLGVCVGVRVFLGVRIFICIFRRQGGGVRSAIELCTA